MRLGKRERTALKARKALESAERMAIEARCARIDGPYIKTSMLNAWPIGKPRVKWGYTANIARRLHRQSK